ncbi:Shikimate kinase (AroK) [Mycobacteroides abscessus subsp. abscessus]|nr:Shikimate kinase (AroK) [Mycobacteroides abscessus subsp. abscessus]
MSQRVPLYREVATIKVNTDRRNPGAVVRMIVSRLENPEGSAGSASSRRRRPRRRPRSRRRSAGAAAVTQTNTSGTETRERADND